MKPGAKCFTDLLREVVELENTKTMLFFGLYVRFSRSAQLSSGD